VNSHPRVAAVVLTWNDRENLAACLDSLGRLTYGNIEIIVSDNGSTDGSLEMVRERWPAVTLIENGRNLFWSGGNNVGIEYALSTEAEWIILLNNDIEVDPHFITALVEEGRAHPEAGLLGPKIYYADTPEVLWYAGGEVNLWKGLIRHRGIREPDRGQYDEPGETDYVTGCALMMRREVPEEIGLLDPSYIAYAEDTDFSLRARAAGWKLRYVPAAVLWHKIGAAWGVVSRRKIRQKLRSQLILLRRYAPAWAWFSTIPLFFLLDGLRILFLIATGRIRGRRPPA